MFHRQCYLTTWFDEARIDARHVGVDDILRLTTTFSREKFHLPDTRKYAEKCLTGMSPIDQQQNIIRQRSETV